ncbi:MAG: hypothetical protein J6S00_05645 [Clostridia bacterium]|nr:hypothetical protein [Clostridia bacterium]
MANEQNLRPGEYKLTQEQAKKGGINSGIARKKKKNTAELINAMLSAKANGENQKTTSKTIWRCY